ARRFSQGKGPWRGGGWGGRGEAPPRPGEGGPCVMAMVSEPGRQVPVVAETDVLVVGGGPAGQAAAVAAARAGAEVMLLERFGYLGGLASGGMVLLLDDMCGEREVSVGGLALEIIDRMARIGACVTPPMKDCFRNDAEVR